MDGLDAERIIGIVPMSMSMYPDDAKPTRMGWYSAGRSSTLIEAGLEAP